MQAVIHFWNDRSFSQTVFLEKDNCFTFSGGERHLQLKLPFVPDDCVANINTRIQSSDELMDLMLLVNILRRHIHRLRLDLPYIPYARQDRATTPDSPQSLKVFADILNSCNFEKVYVKDPHSIVAENLINNMRVVSHVHNIKLYMLKAGLTKENTVLVSPDMGALKKVEKLAKELEIEKVLTFHKVRNPATGEIVSSTLMGGNDIDTVGKNILIVDDICDGGRTFIECAKQLLSRGASLHLFVTHGIFSRGVEPLFEAGFNTIGCTTSFDNGIKGDFNNRFFQV